MESGNSAPNWFTGSVDIPKSQHITNERCWREAITLCDRFDFSIEIDHRKIGERWTGRSALSQMPQKRAPVVVNRVAFGIEIPPLLLSTFF